ncbi:BRO1 domain-containing protein [Plasmodiophora brassicae]|uniref:BRO1 domain-containing protein n=1 Tax=Plasmodiophora brassicae TaxID=37360 RepID=A0A0G4IGP7_PLABS|nr:hypothetical protein PBRA_000158 [Plasmodiophora brassicae]SPQ96722.1 unnamed protein product [Plasmodiophora brassicae]
MLFSFGNPTTAKVRLGEIFLLEQDVAKHNMRAATVVRDTFATQSVKHAMAPPGSDFSPMLDALDEYLPVLVALVEQIHKTYNKNMSEALVFRWTTWMMNAKEVHELPLFEDELCAAYCTKALLHYKSAHALLAGNKPVTTGTKEKLAAAELHTAASIFSWVSTTLIPLSLMSSDTRPTELHPKACEAMSLLCLCHVQELVIDSAVASNKSDGAIAKLYFGLVQQYRSVQQALNGLEHAYHTLEVGFKVWPRLQLEYNHGRALYYLGKMALSERKYGEAISLMQGAVSTLESIRFPECDHPSIDRARNQVKSATAEVKSVLNPLIKDNSTIYFAVVPDIKELPLPQGTFIPKLQEFIPVAADQKQYFDTP